MFVDNASDKIESIFLSLCHENEYKMLIINEKRTDQTGYHLYDCSQFGKCKKKSVWRRINDVFILEQKPEKMETNTCHR